MCKKGLKSELHIALIGLKGESTTRGYAIIDNCNCWLFNYSFSGNFISLFPLFSQGFHEWKDRFILFSIFMHLICLKRKIRIIVSKTELSIPLLSKAFQRLNAKIILCDRILCVTRYVIRISFVICSEILCNSCCNNEVIDYFSPRQSILWSHAIARSCTEVLMLWGNDPAMIIPISNLIN